MKDALDRFYHFLDQPLWPAARLVLVALVIPLILTFSAPLWRISLVAPQYPQGLYIDIHAHKVDGGHGGQDVREINTLNHYIGMHSIDRAALTDLDWIPFALGALVLLTLRVAAIGDVRSLVDLVVISGYVASFAMARFVYRLWVFGHELAPEAPLKVAPFTPAIFGEKQVANFATRSFPQMGTAFVALFLAGIVAVLAVHLVAGRRAAR